jgi:hypothetical protein
MPRRFPQNKDKNPLPFLVQRHTMRMVVERQELESSSASIVDMKLFG